MNSFGLILFFLVRISLTVVQGGQPALDPITWTCRSNEECRTFAKESSIVCLFERCVEASRFHESCLVDNQCLDRETSHLECSRGSCRCPTPTETFDEARKTCVASEKGDARDFGEKCELTDMCRGNNTSCILGVCSCRLDFLRFDGECHPKRYLDGDCYDTRQCVTRGSACQVTSSSIGQEVQPTSRFKRSDISTLSRKCECDSGFGEVDGECIRLGEDLGNHQVITQGKGKKTNWLFIGSVFSIAFAGAVVLAISILWCCSFNRHK